MEDAMKILFSAVTRIGASCAANDNRIYADGKFLNHNAADYIQISAEASGDKCLIALSDGMEDEDSGISMINDLRKFHQKAKNSSKDINIKLDEMAQCVEQTANLLHSVSLGDNDYHEGNTAFAGLLFDEGNVAAVNLGNSRIYKLAGDSFKLLVNDFKRAERLMKMGIISNEQAEAISGRQKVSFESSRNTVKKSDIHPLREGVTYLICSGSLAEAVSEDAIYDILSTNGDADEAASRLVEEAVKNEIGDNVTAIVVKVERAQNLAEQAPIRMSSGLKAARTRKVPSRIIEMKRARKRANVGRIASMIILVLLAAALLYGGFQAWKMLSPGTVGATASEAGQTDVAEGSTFDDETTGYDEDLPGEADSDITGGAIGTGQANNGGDTAGISGGTAEGLVGPEGTTHVVKAGDMLMKLAKRYYGDESKYKLIMDANGIKDPNMIKIGDVLKIPPLK